MILSLMRIELRTEAVVSKIEIVDTFTNSYVTKILSKYLIIHILICRSVGRTIQILAPQSAGKIDETKLAIYNFIEIQIQRYSKRSASWRAA